MFCSGEDALVNHGADDGAMPIFLAAQEGHADCVKLLLEYGASTNYSIKENNALPLHAALQFNHLECVHRIRMVLCSSVALMVTVAGR